MHILRIEFGDISGRPQRLSIHPDEADAQRALYRYVHDNWSEVFDDDRAPEEAGLREAGSLVERYFDEVDTERFSIDFVYLAGPDPFDTVEALQGLVKSFVCERIESILDNASVDNSMVAMGDFETLEGLDSDTRDRIGHARFFLTEANRIVARHGIGALGP